MFDLIMIDNIQGVISREKIYNKAEYLVYLQIVLKIQEKYKYHYQLNLLTKLVFVVYKAVKHL